jgi:hypothetical protein
MKIRMVVQQDDVPRERQTSDRGEQGLECGELDRDVVFQNDRRIGPAGLEPAIDLLVGEKGSDLSGFQQAPVPEQRSDRSLAIEQLQPAEPAAINSFNALNRARPGRQLPFHARAPARAAGQVDEVDRRELWRRGPEGITHVEIARPAISLSRSTA